MSTEKKDPVTVHLTYASDTGTDHDVEIDAAVTTSAKESDFAKALAEQTKQTRLLTKQSSKKEISKKKRLISRFQSLFSILVLPVFSIIGFIDIITDVNLFLLIADDVSLLPLAIIMSLSILSPYLICYASCTRLYLNSGSFDNIGNKNIFIKSFAIACLLLPLGLIHLFLLDVYLLCTTILVSIASLLTCNAFNKDILRYNKFTMSKFIGMSYMNIEGYKRMRSISQLLMESFPQMVLQFLLFIGVFNLQNTDITPLDIVVSLVSTLSNSTLQVCKTKMESMATQETFLSYISECYIGRFVWVPFINDIVGDEWEMRADKNKIHIVDFSNIKAKILCLPSLKIEYYFSDITMRKLIDHLVSVKVRTNDNNRPLEMQQLILGMFFLLFRLFVCSCARRVTFFVELPF